MRDEEAKSRAKLDKAYVFARRGNSSLRDR